MKYLHKIILLIGLLVILSLSTLTAYLQDDNPIHFEFFNIEEPLAETGLDPNCLGKDEAFLPYGDILSVHCDEETMYIESFSFPNHTLMVGIIAWNGQVPIPQPITDTNSWRIAMNPTFTGENTPTVGQGPIAVAVNGVMIFNPTKQDGTYSDDSDPYLVGELDVCGGHSGRGDDYHYHIAPVCIIDELAEASDGNLPIAYALDGFPIYGYTNADDSMPQLDECNGEYDENGNYHYHATDSYPYINGCFKGAFDVSMQPIPHPVREAVAGGLEPQANGGPPQVLITALYQDDEGWIHMEYEHKDRTLAIIYHEISADCFEYHFVDDISVGDFESETHCRAQNDQANNGNPPPNGGNPPPNGGNPPPNGGNPPPTPQPNNP